MTHALLVVLCLLFSAAPASAECAWVLWARGRASDDFRQRASIASSLIAVWHTQGAYQTKVECDSAARSHERIKRALLFPFGLEDTAMAVEAQCVPDTVDPRGPKGSE